MHLSTLRSTSPSNGPTAIAASPPPSARCCCCGGGGGGGVALVVLLHRLWRECSRAESCNACRCRGCWERMPTREHLRCSCSCPMASEREANAASALERDSSSTPPPLLLLLLPAPAEAAAEAAAAVQAASSCARCSTRASRDAISSSSALIFSWAESDPPDPPGLLLNRSRNWPLPPPPPPAAPV